MVGQKSHTFVPPEVAAQRVKYFQEVIRTGKPIRFEDQRSGWYFEIAMHPIFDEQGKVVAVAILSIDQTDCKRAEQALKQAHDELEKRIEERTVELLQANQELVVFRRFVEASSQGFGMAKLNGEIIYVNPAIIRLFPDRRPEDIVGNDVSTIYSEEYMHKREKDILPSVLREGHWQGEVAISHPGGTMLVLQSTFLVRDERGNPAFFATVLTDITERKQAEDALRQSRDQLRAVYDGMSDGLLIADIETKRFVRANASICRMLGYSKEELLMLSVRDIHPEADLAFVVEQFQALVEGKIRVSEDMPVLRKDGSVFHAAISSSLVDYDNRHCVAGFFRDSTERKQAEEALQKSEERYRSYYEQGLLGMAVSNTNVQWTDVNDRFCEIFGSSREEILQQKISDFIHPDDLESFHGSYQQLLTGEANHYTVERRYIRKDGRVIYLNIFVKCFRSAEGTVDHVFALFDNVTERINIQRALRQSHNELQAIYDQAVDGILIVDAKKVNPIRVNSAYCRMVGYSDEEVYSLSPERVHPLEVLPAVLRHLDTVNKGNVARIDNLPFLRKDGCIIYADVVSSPILFNERPCLISFFHDVTERKHVQDALERERQSLWHILQASDHERQTISYEIHDGLAQYLAAANMQLQVFDGLRESKPDEARKAYDAATQLVSQSHSESRRLISEVRHPVIDESGLETAISHLVHEQRRQGGPTIKFDSEVQFKRRKRQ